MVLVILLLLTTPVLVLRNFLSDIFDLLTFPAAFTASDLFMVRLWLLPLVQFRLQPGNILAQLPEGHGILQRGDAVCELDLFQAQLILTDTRLEVLFIHPGQARQKIGLL